jgi:hypothetical protein
MLRRKRRRAQQGLDTWHWFLVALAPHQRILNHGCWFMLFDEMPVAKQVQQQLGRYNIRTLYCSVTMQFVKKTRNPECKPYIFGRMQ